MASGKEIRTKIHSVQSTQKITRAMEMVAASKMRSTQERMTKSRPYAEKMFEVIKHLSKAYPEYTHPLMQKRDETNQSVKIAYIIFSSDRGLCGGLNNNLFRKILRQIAEDKKAGKEVDIYCIGNKSINFFKRIAKIKAKVGNLGDKPSLNDLIGVVGVASEKFVSGEYHNVSICYNEFVNTMTQNLKIEPLLPLQKTDDPNVKTNWDYIYEPGAAEVLDVLLKRYIETIVFQSLLENIACEQSSRMIAMRSASDNAGELIDSLKLTYNKARQAAITQELSEIVAGADAV